MFVKVKYTWGAQLNVTYGAIGKIKATVMLTGLGKQAEATDREFRNFCDGRRHGVSGNGHLVDLLGDILLG